MLTVDIYHILVFSVLIYLVTGLTIGLLIVRKIDVFTEQAIGRKICLILSCMSSWLPIFLIAFYKAYFERG